MQLHAQQCARACTALLCVQVHPLTRSFSRGGRGGQAPAPAAVVPASIDGMAADSSAAAADGPQPSASSGSQTTAAAAGDQQQQQRDLRVGAAGKVPCCAMSCTRAPPSSSGQERAHTHTHTRCAPTTTATTGTTGVSRFLPTSRRLVQFSEGKSAPDNATIVYIDGAFDVFHAGHVEVLRVRQCAEGDAGGYGMQLLC